VFIFDENCAWKQYSLKLQYVFLFIVYMYIYIIYYYILYYSIYNTNLAKFVAALLARHKFKQALITDTRSPLSDNC